MAIQGLRSNLAIMTELVLPIQFATHLGSCRLNICVFDLHQPLDFQLDCYQWVSYESIHLVVRLIF